MGNTPDPGQTDQYFAIMHHRVWPSPSRRWRCVAPLGGWEPAMVVGLQMLVGCVGADPCNIAVRRHRLTPVTASPLPHPTLAYGRGCWPRGSGSSGGSQIGATRQPPSTFQSFFASRLRQFCWRKALARAIISWCRDHRRRHPCSANIRPKKGLIST